MIETLNTTNVVNAETPPSRQDVAFTAFRDAQRKIGNVAKTKLNPAFKSKYVDLATLTEAVTPVLNDNDLFVTQTVENHLTGPNLITAIRHTNGISVATSSYPIISKDNSDPQKFGGGLTYARRYSLMAILGVAAEDDDGNHAAQPAREQAAPPTPAQQLGSRLKASGVTKETLAATLSERVGRQVKTLAELTEAEVTAWLADLDSGVPF